MKKIDWIEDLKAKGEFKLSDHKINFTTYWAYNNSLEAENETLDFFFFFQEHDIPEIVDFCKDNEINEITISSTFSSMITVLAKFEELGCKMAGLTKVNKRWTDIATGKHEQGPAIKMIIR